MAVEIQPEEKEMMAWENLLRLEISRIIGYEFQNGDLLRQAFTDHSYLDQDKKSIMSYERLEYVGDAVLGFLVAKMHYSIYPDLTAGQLTKLRSGNIDTEKLARAALTHRLYMLLRHKKPLLAEQIKQFEEAIENHPMHSFGLIEAPKTLANIVESLIGALYLDSNSMDITWMVIEKLLQPMITPATLETNSVTKLNEICQKHNLKVESKDYWKETGVIEYFIDGEFFGRATYKGKLEVARNRAALVAYERLVTKLKLKDNTNE